MKGVYSLNRIKYLPPHLKENTFNWESIWIVFSSGMISFIASLLANILANSNGKMGQLPILIRLFIGALFFIIVLAVFLGFKFGYLNSIFYHKRNFSNYEVCDMLNNSIMNDIFCMVQEIDTNDNPLIKNMCQQKSLYKIDTILEYIHDNVNEDIIHSYNSNTKKVGRAYTRVMPLQLKYIFAGIYYILSQKCTVVDEETNAYRTELEDFVNKLASKLLHIEEPRDSLLFLLMDMPHQTFANEE